MTREEYDNLLKELTLEDLTTDRQLEIFSELQNDKQSSIDKYNELLSSSATLKEDYEKLKQKTIEDFFKVGNKVDSNNIEENTIDEKVPTYDEVVDEMLGGK